MDGLWRPTTSNMEFLDINSTKDPSLLLHAIHSPFYLRILKRTILYYGFNNLYKKIRETKKFESPVWEGSSLYQKPWLKNAVQELHQRTLTCTIHSAKLFDCQTNCTLQCCGSASRWCRFRFGSPYFKRMEETYRKSRIGSSYFKEWMEIVMYRTRTYYTVNPWNGQNWYFWIRTEKRCIWRGCESGTPIGKIWS